MNTAHFCFTRRQGNKWSPATSANSLSRPLGKKQVRGLPLLHFLLESQFSRAGGLRRGADHVQMTALTRALKLNLNVAYLDGRSPTGKVDFVEFRDPEVQLENGSPITLLYR